MESMMEQVFISIVTDITFLASSTDWDSEVASLITQLFCASIDERWDETKIFNLDTQILSRKPKMEFASLAHQISFFTFSREVNLDSQPKPESELISLIKQIISLFNSKPDSESELVSLITQTTRLEPTQESELLSLISRLVSLKPEPELTSLITQIISRFKSMNWEPLQLISLCPPLHGPLEDEGECNISKAIFWRGTRKTYIYCRYCNGENHEGYEKAPLEIKHSLHPKHSLQLVLEKRVEHNTRCYCCEGYSEMYYECGVCDFALDIACVDKPLPLATHHAKWHAHPLALFPSQASFPCNICALTHSRCPCDFVVHHNCLSLPRVIRISRHPHRICFTPSLDKGSVCRKKMDNDYGAYSCIGKGCLYVAHVKCATQRNVWDGQDLEGVPEEFEEELEPYVKISHGIIQHFSHQQHHLRLDENKDRDYDENKLCQACTTPIYFGNFYSCLECEFILHEKCANFRPKIYHPIHPHPLTLVTDDTREVRWVDTCYICGRLCTGFFYRSEKEECGHYRLDVQCATISEPLDHVGHMHPLFLTSKPGEFRTCGICKKRAIYRNDQTFNCIECDFSMCWKCATIPLEMRYKHDKHMLTLSYGNEASNLEEWCETCEKIIDPKKGFYKCDEYCCVTIHVECLNGKDFYMKPGLLLTRRGENEKVNVPPNNNHMSRPICSECKKRCQQKVVFEILGLVFCSIDCLASDV